MSPLLAVVEELLVATIISEKVLLPRKSMADWALTALSIVLAVTGISLLLLSLDRFLEKIYPADVAALILAVIVFVAACLSAFFAARFRRRKISNLGAARQEMGNNIRAMIEGLCGELDAPVRDSPKTAVLLAALAGFVTARQTG